MKRDYSHLFPLVSVLLLFSSLSYGQSWTGILAPSRAIDWSHAGLPATLPDGETTPNPWTPPTTRTQCGTTVTPTNSSADFTNITNAINACTPGHYVLLGGNGTVPFLINAKLALDGAEYITLRGSGPQNTILKMGSGSWITFGDTNGGPTATLTSAPSNFTRGATSAVVTGNQLQANFPANLAQCDTGWSGSGCTTGADGDNGGLWICGDQTICSNQSASGGHRHQYQRVFVTSVTGTCSSSCTVTFTPGLYMPNWGTNVNFASNRTSPFPTPTLTQDDPSFTAVGIGLEDLTIDFTSGTSDFGYFMVNQAYASWVKGVRFIGPSAGPTPSGNYCCTFQFQDYNRFLFANNFIYAVNPSTGKSSGLIMRRGGDSDVLLLNNWFQGGGINTIEGGGYDSAIVTAYDYFRDNNTGQVYNGDAEHSATPNYLLREGNQWAFSNDDFTWGTHALNTWFRNYFSCYDPPYLGAAAPKGINIDTYARFENAIGNAIGTPGQCTTYQGVGQGTNNVIFSFGSDPLSLSTSMRWGNYDTVTGAVSWNASEVPSSLASPNASLYNPVPSSQTLPASFFMNSMTAHPNGGTGLNWWKVCTSWSTFPTSCSATQTPPMPPIGPDVTGGNSINGYAYDIPAAVAYKNLPIDTTYQNSYTMTGSSWSSGTETLTVSGIPNSGHIMGGFQLSGVNSACLPRTGVSYTGRPDGEILMTGSSATTISYALASNPNTSCTGTMTWPDIRKFDERVYQNDSGGGGGNLAAPTGLSATVQ